MPRYKNRSYAKSRIDSTISQYRSMFVSLKKQSAFMTLISYVRRKSTLLSPEYSGNQVLWKSNCAIIKALFRVSLHCQDWQRPLENWQPSGSIKAQFFSLVNHLFALYPVPFFMMSVWFKGGYESRQQKWFKHMGSGKNIRKADIPVRFTKKQAHYFCYAPSEYSINHALRWGQVLGMGGSLPLLREILNSRLGDHFENEEFWETAIRFFVDRPTLPLSQVGPIIDYLEHLKFCDIDLVPQDLIEPHFTMKGQTVKSILRRVEKWHGSLTRIDKIPKYHWQKTGIVELNHIENKNNPDKMRYWRTQELFNSELLIAEGAAMHHCIATYVWSCVSGSTSIWSMTVRDEKNVHRVLTIEVNNKNREICQVRGKYNRFPGTKCMELVRIWAKSADLKIANCI